jgi:pantoate--beta-alanine ligase
MGWLHEGHRALIQRAQAENATTVVSIFVNPRQFGDPKDLEKYPRNEARDVEIASEEGADLVFAPSVEEVYPPGFETTVRVAAVGEPLEGAARPGHFEGVATVVAILFNLVGAERAYFGQKDAQQVAVLRRMLRDLNLDLELRVLPTVRDDDGLAISSRNNYLSGEERTAALALPRALEAGRSAYAEGSDPVGAARAALNGLEPDYVELVDLDGATVLAAAARIGSTRLIDNVILEIPCQASAWLGRKQT